MPSRDRRRSPGAQCPSRTDLKNNQKVPKNVCVRAHVCVRARACVCVRTRVCVRAHACARVCVFGRGTLIPACGQATPEGEGGVWLCAPHSCLPLPVPWSDPCPKQHPSTHACVSSGHRTTQRLSGGILRRQAATISTAQQYTHTHARVHTQTHVGNCETRSEARNAVERKLLRNSRAVLDTHTRYT